MPEKLHICWLKDDRPGHLTKVRGILKALACHLDISVQEVSIKWRPKFLRNIIPHLPYIPASICLETPVSRPVNLIISAGGATEWANVRLAQILNVPNIFLGSLRSHHPDQFTVLPRIEAGSSPRVLEMDIIPSEIDTAFVQSALAADPILAAIKEPCWTVLIGGNGSGCIWTPADSALQADRIIAEANKARVKLLVTSSRRTGVAGEQIWREHLEKSDRLALGVWYSKRETESQPCLAALLGKAKRIIATEDSASMVNEAIASGKPVATIAPSSKGPDKLLEEMLNRLAAKRYIIRLPGIEWSLANIARSHWSLLPNEWHELLGLELLARLKLPLRNTRHA